LREAGRNGRALDAYRRALAKEPHNLAALWGAANLEFSDGATAAAKEKLATILERDPAYKFGDVSLLYAKTLRALSQSDEARAHLEQHVRKWRQPEALYLLGTICVEQNDPQQARQYLQGLIIDLDSSPRAIARKHVFWRSRAKRLLHGIK
jgi:hypothetical protein